MNIKKSKIPKYEAVVKQILYDLFYEDWMDDDDWNKFEEEFFKKTNLSYSKLSKQIEIGVTRGISVSDQLSLIANIFLKNT